MKKKLIIAPEVYFQQKYEKGCDVWALGVMIYFLLCRELPFDDMNSLE